MAEQDLRGLRYLRHFIDLLAPLHDHCACPNRKKPNKRVYELLCFYFSGWISAEELVQRLQNLPPLS